jgi:hypothetical protein
MLEIYSDWVIRGFTKKLPKGKPIFFRGVGYQFQNFLPNFWRFYRSPTYHDHDSHDNLCHHIRLLSFVVG